MAKSKPTPPRAKKLFKPNKTGMGRNVVLNFTGRPKDELGLQGEAYHRAAKILINELTSRRGYSDLEAYPIVFLYRHSLELLIKAVLMIGDGLADLLDDPTLKAKDIFRDHSLERHLPQLKRIFEAMDWNDAFEQAGMQKGEFEDLIQDFEQQDPKAITFRYTIKKDETASVEKHFTFDVQEFAQRLDPILELLSGACVGLKEFQQVAGEYRAEMAQYEE